MKNKSEVQLLAELSDLDDKSSKLRKEIDKRRREFELKGNEKYVGNYYRNTNHGRGAYCHILHIDERYHLVGVTLYKSDNKYFSFEFNHIIFPNDDNNYKCLQKIPKEKWNEIIKGLKPEMNKGLK